MAKNKVSPKRKVVKAKESNPKENEETTVVAKVKVPDNAEAGNAEADNIQEDTEQGSEDPEQGSEEVESSDSEDSQAKEEAPEDSKKEPEKKTKADAAKPSKTPDQVLKEKKLAGLIFMCKSSTKKDCFQYRVFGLPQSKKDLVERLRPNMKLFLFDSDLRLLHGIYVATTRGGMNLEPRAFVSKSDSRGFPAQVRFRVQKECLPLTEDVFKPAIKDNYFNKNRFNFELGANQVKKLTQLFRPVPRDAGKVHLGQQQQGISSRYDGAGRLGYEANGLRDVRVRGELPYYEPGYRGIPDLPPNIPSYADPLLSKAELRRLEYARDAPLAPADPYQDLYLRRRQLARTVPDGFEAGQVVGNPDLELELLYRKRLQMYSDPRLDRGLTLDPLVNNPPIRKRAYEEAFVDEHALLLAKRQQQLQDELLYRELDFQRAPASSYLDDRLVSRYYAGV